MTEIANVAMHLQMQSLYFPHFPSLDLAATEVSQMKMPLFG